MAFVENDGVSIHYEVVGRGPPLVLQHGFTQSLERWRMDGYVEAFEQRYRIILIDARGHGASTKTYDSAHYSTELMAADVLLVLDAMGVERCGYWGYSMGAAIGFELARAAAGRFDVFVLGGQHPYGRTLPPSTEQTMLNPDAFAESFLRRIGMDLNSMPPKYRKLLMQNDFKALAACQQDRKSQQAALSKMHMPVLLYAGDEDPVHDKAKQASAELANCRFHTLANLNHGTAFRESVKLLPHVDEFLEESYPSSDSGVCLKFTDSYLV